MTCLHARNNNNNDNSIMDNMTQIPNNEYSVISLLCRRRIITRGGLRPSCLKKASGDTENSYTVQDRKAHFEISTE